MNAIKQGLTFFLLTPPYHVQDRSAVVVAFRREGRHGEKYKRRRRDKRLQYMHKVAISSGCTRGETRIFVLHDTDSLANIDIQHRACRLYVPCPPSSFFLILHELLALCTTQSQTLV